MTDYLPQTFYPYEHRTIKYRESSDTILTDHLLPLFAGLSVINVRKCLSKSKNNTDVFTLEKEKKTMKIVLLK